MSMILPSTTDKLQLISSAAGNLDVHASYVDAALSTLSPSGAGKQNTNITTAAITDILAAPAASTARTLTAMTIRNKSTSVANDVTVQYDQNGTDYELHKTTLRPGECLEYLPSIGFFKLAATYSLRNWSTAAQGAGFASDTYLTGSFITFPIAPVVGTLYRMTFDVSKTAAGTATPIVTLRTGSAGTTADTSRCSFTFSAGTAATDVARFVVEALFRTVGSGTAAVLQGRCSITSQATTGNSSLIKVVQTTSAGFDSTTANLGIGCSFNGGTSYSGTVQLVHAELITN